MITIGTLLVMVITHLKVSSTAGQESGGDNCVFPYIFEGETYYTCIYTTVFGFRRYRCSTRAEYEAGSYIVCTDSSEMDNSVYAMDLIDGGTDTLEDTGGYITSHRGYNSVVYPAQVSKTLRIQRHSGYYLLLHFIRFKLDTRGYPSGNCFDHLTIKDVEYCDEELDGLTKLYALPTSGLDLAFRTSYAVEDVGFVAKFTVFTEDCNPERLLTVYETVDWSVDIPNTFTTTCSLGDTTMNERLVCRHSVWSSSATEKSNCYHALYAQPIEDYAADEGNITSMRSGYISSHDYFPQFYTSYINSTLTIGGLQTGQVVGIVFLVFDLYYTPDHPGCDADYLEVIGADTNSSRHFCSDPDFRPELNDEYNFTITGSSLTFRFITNENPTNGSGFLLFYSEYLSTTTATSPTTTAGTDKVNGSRRGKQSQTAVGAGVGVAVLLVVIVVVVVVVILLRRRRDNKYRSPVKAPLQSDDLNVCYNATQGDNLNMHSAYQHDTVGGDNSTYTLAEEITTDTYGRQDDTGEDYKQEAAVRSQQGEGEYDLSDEYQLAGACGDEYENLESLHRAEQEKAIPDVYAAVTGSRKMKKSGPRDEVNELIDNDLYGS